MGIHRPIECIGIFPRTELKLLDSNRKLCPAPTPDYEASLYSAGEGWKNYRSAEADAEITQRILDRMVEKQWAVKCHSAAAVRAHLNSENYIASKLALIT